MANEIFNAMLNKVCQIKDENRELTKLRDWLLPMLMNGQVTIADGTPEYNVIQLTPKTYTVQQAARSFGTSTTDDTADLVKEFLRRKNDPST